MKVYSHAMSRHVETFHSQRQELRFQDMMITRFPFVLLPPGIWEYSQVAEVIRRHSRFQRSAWERRLDLQRIAQIESLKGILKHFGLKCWFGYAVYEFPYSKRVALECPVEGNATYILEGDWKKMICLTKAEIRREHADAHVRVLHTSNWRDQVHQALTK